MYGVAHYQKSGQIRENRENIRGITTSQAWIYGIVFANGLWFVTQFSADLLHRTSKIISLTKAFWIVAMVEEILATGNNIVREITNLPDGRQDSNEEKIGLYHQISF